MMPVFRIPGPLGLDTALPTPGIPWAGARRASALGGGWFRKPFRGVHESVHEHAPASSAEHGNWLSKLPDMIRRLQGTASHDQTPLAAPRPRVIRLPEEAPPKPKVIRLPDESHTDKHSEKHIATLLPQVQPFARRLIIAAAAEGITIRVISGTRTYVEQDALFAQGRNKGGQIVTKARGGYSNHNFGIAFDIGIFEGSKYIPESPNYSIVGTIGKRIGLSWGGDWISIRDEPHFELHPAWAARMSESQMLGELRSRKTGGKALFT